MLKFSCRSEIDDLHRSSSSVLCCNRNWKVHYGGSTTTSTLGMDGGVRSSFPCALSFSCGVTLSWPLTLPERGPSSPLMIMCAQLEFFSISASAGSPAVSVQSLLPRLRLRELRPGDTQIVSAFPCWLVSHRGSLFVHFGGFKCWNT